MYLWLTGLQLHHAYAAATACRPASSIACRNMVSDFMSTYDHRATVIPALLQAVPTLIGRRGRRCSPVSRRPAPSGTPGTQDFRRWADTGQGSSARIITGRA